MWQGKDPTAVAGEDKGKQSMGEKKARKIMGKLKEDARRLKRPWKEMEEEKNKEAAKMKRVREEVEKEMDREDKEAVEKNAKAMPNFPHFGPVVRKRNERKKLLGYECHECKDYYYQKLEDVSIFYGNVLVIDQNWYLQTKV